MRYCAPMNAQPISANSYLRAEGRRTSPVRNLRPETLSRALEAFENGRLGAAARIFEAILSRDDAICGLNLKRKKSVSRLDFEIVPLEDSPKAREHMRTLRDFYSTLRAKSFRDENESGGLRLLVSQMMDCVAMKYSATKSNFRTTTAGSGAYSPSIRSGSLKTRKSACGFSRGRGSSPTARSSTLTNGSSPAATG